MSSYASFREVQRFRAWWIVLLILLPTALAWWGAIAQLYLGEPWGNNPASDGFMWAFFLAFGIGFPLFMFYVHMVTEVSDAIHVRFLPIMLRPRTIRPQDIASHRAEEYDPLGEYGGWGVKGTASNRVYNVSGRKGVRIVLKDGRMVMIGSRRAEELNMAIGAMVRTGPRR